MSPEFDRLVARAHELDLKIGPMSERIGGRTWRVYLQRGSEIFCNAEGPTIEAAFGAVLALVERQLGAAPAADLLD